MQSHPRGSLLAASPPSTLFFQLDLLHQLFLSAEVAAVAARALMPEQHGLGGLAIPLTNLGGSNEEGWPKQLNASLEEVDPEIADIIELEKARQWKVY
ncbi:hypothetical protein Ahy_B05g077845 isoform D [Arachis hypogaea]|uniref:Uncharacterized protein n=1 Tax=Arachis hypogaea TaxID=3818 RepID=A0A444Z5Q1_ARAHY|nr:hypothetical protein Ahy_B05g077845 isoform D [Arachis hypogaea]